MALAGGVTIEIPHRQGYVYHEGEVLAPDGYCRAFDHRAQGTVFGSGVGVDPESTFHAWSLPHPRGSPRRIPAARLRADDMPARLLCIQRLGEVVALCVVAFQSLSFEPFAARV